MDKYFICVDLPEYYSRELEVTKDSFIQFVSFYENILNHKIEKISKRNQIIYVGNTKIYGRIMKYVEG